MFRKITLSIVSALLLSLSWPPITQFTFFIFFAFIPLFIIESYLSEKKLTFRSYYGYLYLTFFLFNLLTTFWVKNAHVGGAIFAILCNSFFMSTVFRCYAKLKRKLRWRYTFFVLPVFWIGFEYLHLNWDLSWPWLTLGNVFASHPSWIQWYSWTGVLGGTLWIFIVNFLFFKSYRFYNKKRYIYFLYAILIIILPLFFSKMIYKNIADLQSESSMKVMVVQPNINPYTEKFTISQDQQMDLMFNLISPELDSSTDFIVLPETFLSSSMWQHKFNLNSRVERLQYLAKEFPHLNIIIGAVTLKLSEKGPRSKPLSSQPNQWYKVFNSALHIDKEGVGGIYNKSKLVPGAEQMPFQNFLHPILGDQILQIGNSTSLGNFAKQDTVSVFSSNTMKIAPIICYESIYGDYTRNFILKGAQAIFIITNDGWWKKTSGYKQHSMYAQLRAIETRRYIARSANTGISSVINHLGEIQESLLWDQKGIITYTIPLYSHKTFYVQHGDFLGRVSGFLTILIFLFYFVNNKLQIKTE